MLRTKRLNEKNKIKSGVQGKNKSRKCRDTSRYTYLAEDLEKEEQTPIKQFIRVIFGTVSTHVEWIRK